MFTVNIVTDLPRPLSYVVSKVVDSEEAMLALDDVRQMDFVLRTDRSTPFVLVGTNPTLASSWKELATSDGQALLVDLAEEVQRALDAEAALAASIDGEAERATAAEDGLAEAVNTLTTTVPPAYQQAIASTLL